MNIELTLNGKKISSEIEPDLLLIDFVRGELIFREIGGFDGAALIKYFLVIICCIYCGEQ